MTVLRQGEWGCHSHGNHSCGLKSSRFIGAVYPGCDRRYGSVQGCPCGGLASLCFQTPVEPQTRRHYLVVGGLPFLGRSFYLGFGCLTFLLTPTHGRLKRCGSFGNNGELSLLVQNWWLFGVMGLCLTGTQAQLPDKPLHSTKP